MTKARKRTTRSTGQLSQWAARQKVAKRQAKTKTTSRKGRGR